LFVYREQQIKRQQVAAERRNHRRQFNGENRKRPHSNQVQQYHGAVASLGE